MLLEEVTLPAVQLPNRGLEPEGVEVRLRESIERISLPTLRQPDYRADHLPLVIKTSFGATSKSTDYESAFASTGSSETTPSAFKRELRVAGGCAMSWE